MLFLKQGSESALRISKGTLFHSFAADTEKVRPPPVFSAVLRTYNIYIHWHNLINLISKTYKAQISI